MESHAETTAPPPPPDISATLRALKPGESYVFPLETGPSVRTLATRIGLELQCVFKTKKGDGGIRVWRLNPGQAQT